MSLNLARIFHDVDSLQVSTKLGKTGKNTIFLFAIVEVIIVLVIVYMTKSFKPKLPDVHYERQPREIINQLSTVTDLKPSSVIYMYNLKTKRYEVYGTDGKFKNSSDRNLSKEYWDTTEQTWKKIVEEKPIVDQTLNVIRTRDKSKFTFIYLKGYTYDNDKQIVQKEKNLFPSDFIEGQTLPWTFERYLNFLNFDKQHQIKIPVTYHKFAYFVVRNGNWTIEHCQTEFNLNQLKCGDNRRVQAKIFKNYKSIHKIDNDWSVKRYTLIFKNNHHNFIWLSQWHQGISFKLENFYKVYHYRNVKQSFVCQYQSEHKAEVRQKFEPDSFICDFLSDIDNSTHVLMLVGDVISEKFYDTPTIVIDNKVWGMNNQFVTYLRDCEFQRSKLEEHFDDNERKILVNLQEPQQVAITHPVYGIGYATMLNDLILKLILPTTLKIPSISETKRKAFENEIVLERTTFIDDNFIQYSADKIFTVEL